MGKDVERRIKNLEDKVRDITFYDINAIVKVLDDISNVLSGIKDLDIDFCPNCNHDTVQIRKRIYNYTVVPPNESMSTSLDDEVNQCSVCGKLWKNETSKVEHKLGE